MKRILIESRSPTFNDVLCGYSLIPLFRKKYDDAKIFFGCNKYQTKLFRRSNAVDEVVLQSIYGNKATWTQYELIIDENFVVDKNWNPEYYFGDLDTPDGWKRCIDEGYGDLKFSFIKDDYDFFYKNIGDGLIKLGKSKYIGIMLTNPIPNNPKSQLYTMSPDKLKSLIEKFRDLEVGFVLFNVAPDQFNAQMYAPIIQELVKDQKDIMVLPSIDMVNLGIMMNDVIDVLVGAQSSIMTSLSMLFDVNRVILSPLTKDQKYVWDGIPDECITTNLRFYTFVNGFFNKGTEFIYPKSDSLIKLDSESYYSIDGCEDNDIVGTVRSMIDGQYVKNRYNVCEKCSLHQTKNCLYWWGDKISPRLGDWEWQNTQ